MKRFLTCALCFVSLPAVAVTLYYEQDGACPGLYKTQPLSGCNATQVTHLNVTPAAGSFNGYFIDGNRIVNADGTFTSDALSILRGANLVSGTEILQTYTCPDGTTETGYGECESSASMITVKLDTRGGSMPNTPQFKAFNGARLTAYVPDRTSFDGAIFAGWVKEGTNQSPNKNAVVSAPAGSTVTYRAVYSCPDGYYMNQYNVCVSDEDEYLTPDGNPVQPNELHCWRPTGPNGTYENYCHWNLLVTFHDNNDNPGYNFSVTYPYTGNPVGNNNKTLTCYGGTGCRAADWCKENRGDIHQGGTCMSIWVPQATDYEFRGYFKQPKNPEDLITDVGTTEGGAFNVFYRTNQNNAYMNITGHAVVVVEPYSTVNLWCEESNGVGHAVIYDGNTVPTCVGNLKDNNPFEFDIYAGWARKCEGGDQAHASCDLIIGDSFKPVNGFGKGDVKYNTSCDAGYALDGDGNRYDPQCEREAGSTLNLTYQFVDQYGLTVNGCNTGAYESCTTSDIYYLPHQAVCGSNNPLKYLSTYSGLYTPNRPVTCGSSVFGNSPATRVVTGYVCRNSCYKGQSIDHGTCVSMPKQSGTINGNEYTDNLWGECNKIECNRGYTLQIVNGTATCVQSSVTPS